MDVNGCLAGVLVSSGRLLRKRRSRRLGGVSGLCVSAVSDSSPRTNHRHKTAESIATAAGTFKGGNELYSGLTAWNPNFWRTHTALRLATRNIGHILFVLRSRDQTALAFDAGAILRW